MSNYPFSETLRDQLAYILVDISESEDPLTFVRQQIFRQNSGHIGAIPTILGRPPFSFYRDVVRYCEMAAWSEDPALIIELLNSLVLTEPEFQLKIDALVKEGPFRCHPPGIPQYVCRVATELPLFGRNILRLAAQGFDNVTTETGKEAKRVLLTEGPTGSGKTYTQSFFRYLEVIQPLKVGVLTLDFGVEEILTQSANLNVPVELFLAQKLEKQARERRAKLQNDENAAPLPGLATFGINLTEPPFNFQPLANEQQRSRWTKSLVKDLVNKVLYRLNPVPKWWVLVFDNCEKAPKEIEQFMQSLMEITAGTVETTVTAEVEETVKAADIGAVRVVLLGDSKNLLPINLYPNHFLKEDLSQHKIDKLQIRDYFVLLGYSRKIKIADDDLNKITDDCFTKTEQIMTAQSLPAENWLKTLTMIVIEKTLEIEKLAAEKRV